MDLVGRTQNPHLGRSYIGLRGGSGVCHAVLTAMRRTLGAM